MTAWRFRRCPQCRQVRPASAFVVIAEDRDGQRWGWRGPARRRCPSCGHIGETNTFTVVADTRKAGTR